MRLLIPIFLLMVAATPPSVAQNEKAQTGAPETKQWPQEPDGFKRIKFGSTEVEAKAIARIERCYSIERSQRSCPLEIPLGGSTMGISLMFSGDKFVTAMGGFRSNAFEDVRAAFFETYGKPHHTTQETVQNRLGGTFQNETHSWYGKSVIVLLSRFGDTLDRGMFVVGLRSEMDKETKEREGARKNILK